MRSSRKFEPAFVAAAVMLAASLVAACTKSADDGKPLPNIAATVPAASAAETPPGIVANDATAPAGGASGIATAVTDAGSGAAGATASTTAQAGHGAETSPSKSAGPGNGSTAVGGMAGGQATGGATGKKSAPTAGDGTAAPAKSASQ